MILFNGNTPATLCVDSNESACVRLAAQDLLRDLAGRTAACCRLRVPRRTAL